MSGEAWDSKTEKKVTDAAESATELVSDLGKRGLRVASDLDQQLQDFSGRSSGAWLDEGARLFRSHPWKTVAATAVIAFVIAKLRA